MFSKGRRHFGAGSRRLLLLGFRGPPRVDRRDGVPLLQILLSIGDPGSVQRMARLGVLAESSTRCAFAALCPEEDDVVSADGCWLLFWRRPVSPPWRRKRKASYESV
jgi:hypothetical protein